MKANVYDKGQAPTGTQKTKAPSKKRSWVWLVIGLILLNGVFAMSELAIVSARKPRLEAMARAGRKGARCALDLAADFTAKTLAGHSAGGHLVLQAANRAPALTARKPRLLIAGAAGDRDRPRAGQEVIDWK